MGVGSLSMRFAACAGVACALLSSPAVLAQGKDELWDVTMKMEMAGLPMSMPARTHRVCVEKGNDAGLVPKGEKDECKVVDQKRVGNKFTFRVACSGKEPMTGSGEFTYSADSYDGRMQMKGTSGGQSFDMTQTVSGKKVGNCTSTMKQDLAKAQAQVAEANVQVAQMCEAGLTQLNWQLYEPNGPCAERRADFCPAVTKAAYAASEPAGYAKARKETMLAEAMGKCGKDFAVVTQAACGKGMETRDWAFVGSGACDDNVRTVGEANCKGRSFTGMDRGMVPLCSRYASLMRGNAATPVSTAAPPPAQPTATDAISESVNKLKKLLPF